MFRTDMYEGLLAETATMTGTNGDRINAYMARPLGAGPAIVEPAFLKNRTMNILHGDLDSTRLEEYALSGLV